MNPFTRDSETNRQSNKDDMNQASGQLAQRSRRSILKLGGAALIGGLAGCVDYEGPKNTGTNSSGGQGTESEDTDNHIIQPVQIDSFSFPRKQIRDSNNLHLANMWTSYVFKRLPEKVNGRYAYVCELQATVEPKHGDAPPYKSDLKEVTLKVDIKSDDFEVYGADPSQGQGYDVDERKTSDSIRIGLTPPIPSAPGVSLQYSNTYQINDGRVYGRRLINGKAGSYTLAWRETNTKVFEPVTFEGVVTMLSDTKYDEVTDEHWTPFAETRAEARLCKAGFCNPLG